MSKVNSLPNKILDRGKLKAFADNKINVIKKLLRWTKNIVGKEENAVFQHFLLFPQFFQKASFLGSLKVGTVWYRVKGCHVNTTSNTNTSANTNDTRVMTIS